jgi:hypothetical protein
MQRLNHQLITILMREEIERIVSQAARGSGFIRAHALGSHKQSSPSSRRSDNGSLRRRWRPAGTSDFQSWPISSLLFSFAGQLCGSWR